MYRTTKIGRSPYRYFSVKLPNIGQNIEYAFLNHLVGYLKATGIETITAEYIPSAKNFQTENFYEQGNFTLCDTDNGTKRYILHTNNHTENSFDLYQFE